jgi:hypothetical protein
MVHIPFLEPGLVRHVLMGGRGGTAGAYRRVGPLNPSAHLGLAVGGPGVEGGLGTVAGPVTFHSSAKGTSARRPERHGTAPRPERAVRA